MNEELTQAEHSAEFLAQHIRSAHSAACKENPVAEIVLLDLIVKVAEIESRLKQLNGALNEKRIIFIDEASIAKDDADRLRKRSYRIRKTDTPAPNEIEGD